ncbi:hypothetical protein AMTRI_Chr11g98690 [Amborella trichopoda]
MYEGFRRARDFEQTIRKPKNRDDD